MEKRDNIQDILHRKIPERMNTVDRSCQGSLNMMNRAGKTVPNDSFMRSNICYCIAIRNNSGRLIQMLDSLPLAKEII